MSTLSKLQRCFVEDHRVARLATADDHQCPHVVPVCFSLEDDSVYITIDRKPKRRDAYRLKRLRNIAYNPAVALVVDRYSDNWDELGWVMLRGQAEILERGNEHDVAQQCLAARYPQYAAMSLHELPVIAIRISNCVSWGMLELSGGEM